MGSLYELAQVARTKAGLKPLEPGEKVQGFMTQSVLALSDAQSHPAPMAMQLTDFTQVQASVFQVARAPGKRSAVRLRIADPRCVCHAVHP